MNDDKEKKYSPASDSSKDNENKISKESGTQTEKTGGQPAETEKKAEKGFFAKIFKGNKDKSGFISARESKRISKENNEITREYEKRKKRKNVPESEYVTTMKDPKNIVEFDNLHTYFFTDAGTVKAVNGVTFSIPQGKTVGVVGESGCGKSVTSFSLMQLVAGPAGQVIEGSEIRFRSTIYKEENGKKIPIYEYEDGGAQIIKTTPKVDEKGQPVLDKDGNPVMGKVQKTDEKGQPLFETVYKINSGEKTPVFEYETVDGGAQVIKTRSKLDKQGQPVRNKKGDAVMEKVQKTDENGNPLFETVYKKNDGKRIPVFEYETVPAGTQTIKERIKKDKDGLPVLDKDGNPVMEKVQKTDDDGIPLFEMEDKVYNVAKMPIEVMRKIRGREIAMIFQEPMTSLNPIFTIGNQLDEVVLLHIPGATKQSAKKRTFEMLKLVGIIPENVYDRYPHELSGGMRQRVCIAMVLSCTPKLIIADEPTTALDVTIQAQILDLLRDIKDKISGSIMLITHDLGVIAEMADFVVVMYAGRIIEMGTAKEIFDNPMHPYTIGLQKSKPSVNKQVDRLYSIPGNVPNPINMPSHCYFKGRCEKKIATCGGDYPCMINVSGTHKVACHLYAGKEGK